MAYSGSKLFDVYRFTVSIIIGSPVTTKSTFATTVDDHHCKSSGLVSRCVGMVIVLGNALLYTTGFCVTTVVHVPVAAWRILINLASI